MYGLQGGAVKLILLLVSDIDDNFWFLTAVQVTGLKNLLSLTKHHLLPHHQITQRPIHYPSLYKAVVSPQLVMVDVLGGSGLVNDTIETDLAGFTQLRRRTVGDIICLIGYKCILVTRLG